MKLNVRFSEEEERFRGVQESDESFRLGFGEVQTETENDYNKLINKPSINSITLEGAMTAYELGLGRVYYDTKANWDQQTNLIAEKAAIYIYSDYEVVLDRLDNVTEYAGIKIGDGKSYLIDMPFITDYLAQIIFAHLADRSLHITEAEREFWNNKVSTYFNDGEPENLVFSKTHYVID